MSVESYVQLELSWQGDYFYKKKSQIDRVKIALDKSSGYPFQILALIDKTLSSLNEQLLFFTSKHQRSTRLLDKELYLRNQLNCPLHLIRELKLSVEISPSEQKKKTSSAKGSSAYQRHSQIRFIPLTIEQLPELEPDAAYQLKIVHQDHILSAFLVKKVHQIVAPHFMEESNAPICKAKGESSLSFFQEKPLNAQNQKWWEIAGYLIMDGDEAPEEALEIKEDSKESFCSSVCAFICYSGRDSKIDK